jgi:drug/metabolite transporter (DMT)-like permease
VPAPETIFVIILFSAIGLAAFRHGKRQNNIVCLLLGIALMVYPYFVEGLLLNLAIGAALTAVVWKSWNT